MTHLHHPLLLIGAAVIALVAWGRWRSDIVAVLALLAAVATHAVPPDAAFAGFAHPAVAILALLSIVGVAIRNAGLIEAAVGGLRPLLRWDTARVGVLGTLAGSLSAVIGALPVLSAVLPTALQGLRREGQQGLPILLPVRLLAVFGGLATGVGSLPNLLVWTGGLGQLGLFDFATAGLPVALAALATTVIAWRLLPRAAAAQPGAASDPPPSESYISELVVPRGSPLVGDTVRGLEAGTEGAVTLKGIVRETFRRIAPRGDWVIEADDVLVLSSEPAVLQRLMVRAGLQIVGGAGGDLNPERVGVVEAVVTPASELVGRSPEGAGLRSRQISLLAIGRSGRAPTGRLHRTMLQAGDVLMLQGELATLPGRLAALGCLTLTERRLRLGRRRQVFMPLLLLGAALGLAAAALVPLPVSLLGAVLVLALSRGVTLEEIYTAIPWPVVVLTGALLPLSLALWDGGTAAYVAEAAAPGLALLPLAAVPVLVLAAALLLANLVGGAVTVLLLGPLAAAMAARLGLPPGPVLAALALGASSDMVMRARRHSRQQPRTGAAEAWRTWPLLLPLGAVVLVVGSAALLLAWPLPAGTPWFAGGRGR